MPDDFGYLDEEVNRRFSMVKPIQTPLISPPQPYKPITDKEHAQLLNTRLLLKMAEDQIAIKEKQTALAKTQNEELLDKNRSLINKLKNSVPIHEYGRRVEDGLLKYNNFNFRLGFTIGAVISGLMVFCITILNI